MDKLYSPENILKFSSSLIQAVQQNDTDNLDSLLAILKVIVNGPPGERCQSFYNHKMSPDMCIAAVLTTKSMQDALISDSSKCEKLMNTILRLPYLTVPLCRAISTLVSYISGQSIELKREISGRILEHKDLYKFDVKTVNICLREDPTSLELLLLKLCTQDTISQEDFISEFDHWIRWSSESSQVFQIVTGILNELLVRLKCKKRVLRVVELLIKELQKTCDRNDTDITSLYPNEVQCLITMVQMDPSALEGDENFQTFVKDIRTMFYRLMEREPCTALLLSTHYPNWNKLLL